MTKADLLNVNRLHIQFDTPAGPVDAVRDLSLRIRPKSSVVIVGESGSGKSVCAQAIMGILPNNGRIVSGEILFRDPQTPGHTVDLSQLDLRGEAYRAIRGGRISMIFQEPMTSLSPLHTIGNQITEALMLHEDATPAQGEARATEMLRLVRFPDPARAFRSYPFELSGGLRQRAMIAMALVCRPALLVADEPTTALDVTVQAQILGLVRDIQQELDMSVLMITHDMGVVANVAEEVVVVYRGEVMESGMVEDLFGNPQHPYLKALMHAVPKLDGNPDERLVPLLASEADIAPTEPRSRRHHVTDTTVLSVRRLIKRYQIRSDGGMFAKKSSETLLAVDNVSFDLKRGECLGLVGESGCGKTTVAKLVMGAISADAGEIIYDNDGKPTNLVGMSDKQLVPFRPRIQYIFQDPFGSLNPRMTVLDILTEPLRVHRIGDRESQRQTAVESMRRVGIDPRFLTRYPHSFSGGQRQRIGIARALMLKPGIVICDEPVSALDVSTQAQVLNLLRDLQDELGLTLLFISHDLSVVNYIADRVAVMCRGRLVEIAPRASLFSDPRHPYTRALLASVPHPDLDHPLDFKAIGEGQMSEPANWPEPFHRDGAAASLVDLGGGHFVRMVAESDDSRGRAA